MRMPRGCGARRAGCRINFSTTADLRCGRERGVSGPGPGTAARRGAHRLKFGMKMDEQRRGAVRIRAAAVEDSLRRLATDRIDLYNCTSPISKCPSSKRWVRWTTWYARERCARLAPRIFRAINCAHLSRAYSRPAHPAFDDGHFEIGLVQLVRSMRSVASRRNCLDRRRTYSGRRRAAASSIFMPNLRR